MRPIPKHIACKLRRCEYACKIVTAHNGSALTPDLGFLTAGHYCLFPHVIRFYRALSLNCTAIWYDVQKQCITGVETLGYAAEGWLDFCQLVCSLLTSQLTSQPPDQLPDCLTGRAAFMPSKCTFQKPFPVAYNFNP